MKLCYFEHIPQKYFTFLEEKIPIKTKNKINFCSKQETKNILQTKYTRYGLKKPSVTQIISLMPIVAENYWLLYWLDKITSDNYMNTQEKNQAIMNRGTLLHECLENILQEKEDTIACEDSYINDFLNLFKKTELPNIETLFSEKFYETSHFCGTIDLIAKDKKTGKIFIGDFKTTTKDHAAENSNTMQTYRIQLTAYLKLLTKNSDLQPETNGYIYQFSFKNMQLKKFKLPFLTSNDVLWENFIKTLVWYHTITT